MPSTRQRSLRSKIAGIICLLIATASTSLISGQALAQATGNRATFPENFKEYVLYGTYDRGSSKEEAFATPETIAAAKSGKPLPPGTQLVLAIWTDYKLVSYFVMQKGVDWGLASSEDERTGDWHFQQFDINGQVKREAIADRCQSCHGGRADNDFMFTIDKMRAYLP
ncbi:hypothetical protein IE4771_PB00052 (plasmid) [Rhizobium etli bv. mimosae str. IE4771]|uniref:Cytochrome P460 domain-containing protein n=1 Tax=Rhizobium etli bv. mimosae str. IE4771 TaxID=1432050 RepID=A0A060I7D0_RHIET|nr:cytochrome P460 family protein [Rhizobium sp. IE4771]AIC29787.1 hypothetical protein IE4771_PB00052 [Rhizobium sp. IE4771]